MPELTLESLPESVRAFFDSLPEGNGETVLVRGGRAVFHIVPHHVMPAAPPDRTIPPRTWQGGKNQEHLDYLKRMVESEVLDPRLGELARAVWDAVSSEFGGRLPVPAAAAFPGGPVEYHWEFGPHQLTIEVPANEPCHWFYRNKATGGTWGIEAPITDGVPPQFLAYLQHLLPSAG